MRPLKIDGIEVRSSPGKGRGVFATKAFRRGDNVEISPVIVLSPGDGDVVTLTKLDEYVFGIGQDGMQGTVVALGYASLYNHSAQSPNCDWVASESVIIIKAIRNIKKGEELIIDYGWDNETLAERGIKPDRDEDE